MGPYVPGKTREIVVELFSKYAKDDILKGRKKLKEFDMTRNVWINEDLPARVRKTRGVMREIVRRAEEKGIPCAMNGDKLICKNMTYGPAHLKALPIGIHPDDLKTRTEGNRIGFMSEDSYLSNFYKCPVTVNDYTFASAEHAIQYKRSLVCKREDVGIEVKQKLKAEDAKGLGDKIPPCKEWDDSKVSLVKCIVKQKFVENNDLKMRLLNTAGFKLEEASVDRYWGTGIPVYSREFRKSRYPGKNVMGLILEEIRDKFLPESARNRRVSSRLSQTEEADGAGMGGSSALNKSFERNNGNHRKSTGNDNVPNQEQLNAMNKHLQEMSESTLRSMLKCLKTTNSSPDIQRLVILRLGELSAEQQ